MIIRAKSGEAVLIHHELQEKLKGSTGIAVKDQSYIYIYTYDPARDPVYTYDTEMYAYDIYI